MATTGQAVVTQQETVSLPVGSAARTTSELQPPGRVARFRISLYANLFGAGLLVSYIAAASAMLRQLPGPSYVWWDIRDMPAWHLVALLICSLPYILAFGAVNLYRWSAFSHYDFRLVPRQQSATPELSDAQWQDLTRRAVVVWDFESQRFSEGRRMAILHGVLFGFISSLTLLVCTMVLAPYLPQENGPEAASSAPALIAIAVGTATAFVFVNDVGRILFRVALRDAGAEIFAYATKNSLTVVASALLFATLLCSGLSQLDGTDGNAIPLGVPGFIVIGATIAMFGGRAVRFVSERAASVLGMPVGRATDSSDLSQIEGLGEDDVGRLAEEGVDSLHALAFVPLPRLFLNTKYGLERLCDWQDQALLLVHVGQAKARLLSDHLLVRGAMAAQDAARQFRDGGSRTAPLAMAPDTLANLLGFASGSDAAFALGQLAGDEVVNRLRVYATAAHALEWSNRHES